MQLHEPRGVQERVSIFFPSLSPASHLHIHDANDVEKAATICWNGPDKSNPGTSSHDFFPPIAEKFTNQTPQPTAARRAINTISYQAI